MSDLVPGYCHRCRIPVGPCHYGSADWVFCADCAELTEDDEEADREATEGQW
jgi:hypothetical protein